MTPDDLRLREARAMDIFKVADDLRIDRLSREHRGEKTGPCPVCGGTDRFSLNKPKGLFNCRTCGGGDVIRLVEIVRRISFREALDWLCGPSREISEEERQRRADQAAKDDADRQRQAEAFRQGAIRGARNIWRQSLEPFGSPVLHYLVRRGIPELMIDPMPRCLRFHPALPYTVGEGDRRREIYRGPAMLAAIQKPNRRAEAVHRTWLDLSQPKGKAVIIDPETGEVCEAKKVLGSKKGGAIRLTGDLQSEVLVMGEGIETTLSALCGWDGPEAMFWAGVDLGNMAGRRLTGKGLKYAGLPDMADEEAFVPPPWVRRLIYVMDGDSEPRETEAKLRAGLRRAMALVPGLQGQIARAPQGMDLNDVLMTDPQPEEGDDV